jgi:hypothetical protein
MTDNYMYSGKPPNAESARGVHGILCRTVDGTIVFRVYDGRHAFTDYEIRQGDLRVTIDADELASFYNAAERHVLDHSPEVLGLRRVEGAAR